MLLAVASALSCMRIGPRELHAAPMWSLVHVSHYTHKYLVLLQVSLPRVGVLPIEAGRWWQLDRGIVCIGSRSALLGRSALVALECGSQRMTCRLELQAPWPKDAFG